MKKKDFEKKPVKKKTLGQEISKKEKTKLKKRAFEEDDEDFLGEDLVTNPDLVATKYPLTSAAFFFNSNNLWSVCDRGRGEDVVTEVSRRVNGGFNGLDHRKHEFKRFEKLLLV